MAGITAKYGGGAVEGDGNDGVAKDGEVRVETYASPTICVR